MDYKRIMANKIAEAAGLDPEKIKGLIEIPPRPEMGDFAFPCFALAKELRKAPNAIALQIRDKIDLSGIDRVETIGPYLNFFLNKGSFVEDTVREILQAGDDYGKSRSGEGKTVLVEYSSPNIAKPFNVALMYTTCLGNALYNIHKFEGYDTVGINHLGDYGTQFGKLIYAYGQWGDEAALEADPIRELTRIYVKFHREAEADPTLNEAGRNHFKKLEAGEPYETGLWTRFRDLSLKDFNKVYAMLNINFDSIKGEAFYSDQMADVVESIRGKGLLTESMGAQVVMLDEYNMPPAMILKSDGSTIYATRDITAAIYRKNTYDFYKCLYVVGNTQSLHFKQVFKVVELMGNEWAKDLIHVPFGLVNFQGMKFSTREGNIIYLEDFLKDAVEVVKAIIEEKNPELENKDEIARKVGIGGVKFIYLKNSREKEITFDIKEVLNFDGETGPYVQYTYARARSILRKNPISGEGDLSALTQKEEFELAKVLEGFNKAVLESIDKYEPSVVTRYVLETAKAFNKFYNNIQISNSESSLKNARLQLTSATCQVIKSALGLLGIEVVDRM